MDTKEVQLENYRATVIEEVLLKALSQTDPELFLFLARKSAESIVRYLLFEKGKIDNLNAALQFGEMKEKLERDPRLHECLSRIQDFGNTAVHYSLGKATAENVQPCRTALSYLAEYFYNRRLSMPVPEAIAGLLSPRTGPESGVFSYPEVFIGAKDMLNALRYRPEGLPFRLYNFLTDVYEYIFKTTIRKVPEGVRLPQKGKIDFNKANAFLLDNNIIGQIPALHLRHLGSFCLTAHGQKGKEAPVTEEIRQTIHQAVNWFFGAYFEDMPEEFIASLSPEAPLREEKDRPPADKRIVGWLFRSDGRQSMAFSLYPGENVVGRQSIYRNTPANKIIINAIEISRRHAVIRAEEAEDGFNFFLEDNAPSKNGTFLNDAPEPLKAGEPAMLKDGDMICLGKDFIRLLFKKAYASDEEGEEDEGLSHFDTVVIP